MWDTHTHGNVSIHTLNSLLTLTFIDHFSKTKLFFDCYDFWSLRWYNGDVHALHSHKNVGWETFFHQRCYVYFHY